MAVEKQMKVYGYQRKGKSRDCQDAGFIVQFAGRRSKQTTGGLKRIRIRLMWKKKLIGGHPKREKEVAKITIYWARTGGMQGGDNQ